MSIFRPFRAFGQFALASLALSACGSCGGTPEPTPEVVVNAPAGPLGPGQTFQFDATVDGVAGTAVLWNLPQGGTAGGISGVGLYAAGITAGTYQVVAKTSTSPQGTDTSTVTVIADPIVAILDLPDSVDALAGTLVVHATALTGVTYGWEVTGGQITNTATPGEMAFSSLDTAAYVVVTVTATNVAGRSDIATDSARVVGRILSLAGTTYGVAISSANVLASARWLNDVVRLRSGTTRGILQDVAMANMPVHIAFAPSGSTLYSANQGGGVGRIIVSSGVTSSSSYGHVMFNLAVNPANGDLYFTSGDGWVFKADPTTLAKLDSVPVDGGSNGAAFGGGTFWVSTLGGRLYKLDPATLDVLDSLELGGTPQRVAVSNDGSKVYIANEGGPDLQVVTTATKAVTSVPVSGSPYGLALAPNGAEVWVAVRDEGRVERFSTATLLSLGNISVGGTPRNVAFSPDGTLVLIGTESNSILIRR